MAIHHHGDTVVTDREGPSAVLIALMVLLLVGFLIWLFAFSGIVFDNDGGGTTNIEENTTNTTIDPGTTGGDTTGDTGTNTGPSP